MGIRALCQRSAVITTAARDRHLAKWDRHPKGVRALRIAPILAKAGDKRTRLPAEGRAVGDSLRGCPTGRADVLGLSSLRGTFDKLNGGHGRRKRKLDGLR